MCNISFHHVPVLFNEVITSLNPKADGIYVDGTLGGGGHSEGIMKYTNGLANLYGIDRDLSAIASASARLKDYPRFTAIHGNFHDVKTLLPPYTTTPLNGALLDLGVSSYQLDCAERGFSYHEDAPLDMRMDRSKGQTAAEFLATLSQQDMAKILLDYGEEKWAARIASIFVEKRNEKPILTTKDLVQIVDAAIPKAIRRKDDGHPARRTFQAIRIALNDELAPLEKALEDFVDCLDDGGRLLVITFHSLEDRLVKRTFKRMQNPCICPPKAPICTCHLKPLGKPIGMFKPTKEELLENNRARSATLRVFERGTNKTKNKYGK